MIYNDGDYRIIERRCEYILVNSKGAYNNHGHFSKESACHVLIKLIKRRQVPNKPYMREAAMRVSTDTKYKDKILNKIEKDKQKQRFYKVNNGVR